MATAAISYKEMFDSMRRRDNYMEVFNAATAKLAGDVDLSWVRSCVGLGTCDGQCELILAERCLPNLRTFIAVEPDHESVDTLRQRLKSGFPKVHGDVHETTLQSWKGVAEPVDLVLMFHVLYYVEPAKRRELFRNLYEDWLSAHGLVAIISLTRTTTAGTVPKLYEHLGRPLVPWDDIESDMLAAGFQLRAGNVYELEFVRDHSDPDDALLQFYHHQVDQSFSEEDVRIALEELYPGQESVSSFFKLAVFERKPLQEL